MLKDKRSVDDQIKDFLNKYGSGNCKETLQDVLLEGIEKGQFAPVVVTSVKKDDKGNVELEVKSPLPFEKRVALAKKMEDEFNKVIDEQIAKRREKDIKEYRREHGGHPPFDYDFALKRVPTKEDKERLDRLLNPPIEEKIQSKKRDILWAIDRVNTARKDQTRKQYVRNAQRKICELQDLQDELLKKKRESTF